MRKNLHQLAHARGAYMIETIFYVVLFVAMLGVALVAFYYLPGLVGQSLPNPIDWIVSGIIVCTVFVTTVYAIFFKLFRLG